VSSSTVKTLTGNIPATTAKDAWFTTLCTHKDDADRINASRLMQVKLRVHHKGVCMSPDLHSPLQLSSESHLFEAQDKGSEADCRELKYTCPARESLVLKEGATVILLRNLSAADGLVNGRTGVVKHIEVSKHSGKVPVVRFSNGTTAAIHPESWNITRGGAIVATRTQLPLDLAWAFSVHKSQGMSLDYLRVSLSKCFEAGQGYVALSRARSLGGLHVMDMVREGGGVNIRGFGLCFEGVGVDERKGVLTCDLQDASTIRANPKVVEFYARMRSDTEAIGSSSSITTTTNTTTTSSSIMPPSSPNIIDSLKGRWTSLMASVQHPRP
jgi:hypothetical protein